MRCALVVAMVLVWIGAAIAEPLPRHDIVSEDVGESRRVVTVRLERRLGEDELTRIATYLRKKDEPTGRRTLVNFFLPGMKLNEQSWAFASFAPTLKVTVHGLSLDEEAAFRLEAARETRPVVGMWLTQAPAVPGLLVIFREKSRLYAEWRVRGGLRTVEEVVESRGAHGRRFDIVGDAGQHYVLVSGGDLELREKSGLIAVAEPVKPDASPVKAATAKTPAAPVPTPKSQAGVAETAGGERSKPASVRIATPTASITVTDTPAAAGTAAAKPVTAAAVAPAAPATTSTPAATAGSAAEPRSGNETASTKTAAIAASTNVVVEKGPAEREKPRKAPVAKKHAAKPAPAPTPADKPKWRIEADVSVINKRLVN